MFTESPANDINDYTKKSQDTLKAIYKLTESLKPLSDNDKITSNVSDGMISELASFQSMLTQIGSPGFAYLFFGKN